MNGYRTRIFEMHTLPGGLCTAWKRQGYTIDACIHWLVGSAPGNSFHRYWEEVGIMQGREFVDLDEFARYEGADGRTFVLYSDVDRLEQHMLAFSPGDAEATRQFIRGVRLCLAFDEPSEFDPPLVRLRKTLKLGLLMATRGREMQRWVQTTMGEFAGRFHDPVIRDALARDVVSRSLSMFFMLYTFAWLHARNAGYPIGGSLPMSRALEQRYLDLGGEIHYHSRVEQVLVEADKAVGVRLADGSEHRADRVISAADGHSTIFKMLDGRYADAETRAPYEKWPTFPALLFVGLGVNRSFADEPQTVSGFSFALRKPTEIADAVVERLPVHMLQPGSHPGPARQDQPGGDVAEQLRLLASPGQRPGRLRREEGPGGAHGGDAARPTLSGPLRPGGDGGCGDPADLGALHGQLERQLRGVAAHTAERLHHDAARCARPCPACRTSTCAANGWSLAAACRPAS